MSSTLNTIPYNRRARAYREPRPYTHIIPTRNAGLLSAPSVKTNGAFGKAGRGPAFSCKLPRMFRR